ncbi:MAG: putative glycoside hydrolase [Candidatus Pacebacteria bacterium]|nr:putative glycoside hydrolase [Candidatus Paceibacterota bacterium]
MKENSLSKNKVNPKSITKFILVVIFIIGLGFLVTFISSKYFSEIGNYEIEFLDTRNKNEVKMEAEKETIEVVEIDKKLQNPPEEVKALYVTAWSTTLPDRVDGFIDLIKKEKLNAVIIDVKDYSGYIAYDIENETVLKYEAKKVIIPDVDDLIQKFHDNDIYVIARVTVFQDPILAVARPDLAIKNKATGGLWKDNSGLAWIDPASIEARDYIVEIAKDASERGFDEINFDYIRFPSDGRLSQMSFPFYDSEVQTKREAMKEVFEHFRENLPDLVISVDLFGLATVNKDDLGIGQTIEDAFENFDYICPMVYPSHYANGFIGFQNPAQHPYEVVKYSINHAVERLEAYRVAQEENSEGQKKSLAKIRPWLQAFDIGAVYGPNMIRAQIDASNEAGGVGWILWNASNRYSTRVVNLVD